MLRKLTLANFRCFGEHSIEFRRTAILVGRNNAGKSSLVEALRLIALAVRTYRARHFQYPPAWTDLERSCRGFALATHNIDLTDRALINQLRDNNATLTALFGKGITMTLTIGVGEGIFVVIRDKDGMVVATPSKVRALRIPRIAILPEVGPVRKEEDLLTMGYVRGSVDSRLAPLHFRNQLHFLNEFWDDFVKLVDATWPQIQVKEVLVGGVRPDQFLRVLIRDEGFTAELASMGQGLQVWLQILWFLTRSPRARTIILDEPDVYLHADLQRRLIRALRRQFRQVIVATHSVEIIAEVVPEDVIVVERKRPRSRYTDRVSAVQHVIEAMGGVHNLQLARLGTSNRFLVVEGKDVEQLSIFQECLDAGTQIPLGAIPNMSMGGWGGFELAIGSGMAMKNIFGVKVRVYCILDRDYFQESQVEERMDRARKQGIELHVWERKEIENYLLSPKVVSRLLVRRARKKKDAATEANVQAVMVEACEREKKNLIGGLTDQVAVVHRRDGWSASRAMKEAEEFVESRWATLENRLSVVSGKAVLSSVARWAHQELGASVSQKAIIREMQAREVPGELARVIRCIEQGTAFRP